MSRYARAAMTLALALSLAACAHRADEAPPEPTRVAPTRRTTTANKLIETVQPVRAEMAPAPSELGAEGGAATGAATSQARLALAAAPPVAGITFSTGSFVQFPDGSQVGGSPAFDAVGSFDTEAYAHVAEYGFLRPADSPLSTFSIDVDTASYANVRRFLENGSLPPADAVRIEELLNYFRYEDPAPAGKDPFSVTTEIADCPWNQDHRLMRIGLRGRSIPRRDLPPRNLVFLVDVSGSMQSPEKLPLVKDGLRLLIDQLDELDRVSMVVYAGAAGVVLEPTSGADRGALLAAVGGLEAGGSTNGAQGIERAYELAERSFIEGGANRVMLCTDGDFNVGVTSEGELVRLIEREREKGVFLTVLGFGMGNLKDSTMEALADHGNGNYAYIDSLDEAEKVLVTEADATLVTIAKDVKIQVELNPATVEAYRLVGYDNRRLANEDFNDDRKDAGEIGAGHSVTALYEIVPKGGTIDRPGVDPLRYQVSARLTSAAAGGEIATVKLRYKQPDGDRSELLSVRVADEASRLASASGDLRFAAAVATFGLVLHESEHRGDASLDMARALASDALGADAGGHRAGFLRLVERARELRPAQVAVTTR